MVIHLPTFRVVTLGPSFVGLMKVWVGIFVQSLEFHHLFLVRLLAAWLGDKERLRSQCHGLPLVLSAVGLDKVSQGNIQWNRVWPCSWGTGTPERGDPRNDDYIARIARSSSSSHDLAVPQDKIWRHRLLPYSPSLC